MSTGFNASANAVLDGVVASSPRVPGVVATVTDGHRNIYQGAAGKRRLDQAAAMTTDSVFAIFSTTKALAALFRPLQKRPHLTQIKAAKRRAVFLAQQNNLRSGGHSGARAGADGGGSAQRNGRRGDGPQRGEASRALACIA